MANQGGFFKGEKKKSKKDKLEQNAGAIGGFYTPPKVEIIKKGKKEW